MRRSNGQVWAPTAWLWPAITAACLASTGAAQACPSSNAKKRAAVDEQALALRANEATVDCPYTKRGCERPMSTTSKIALAAAPVAFGAFVLGWRSGGRRRRNDSSV